jgi:hypothetical protein
MLAARLKRYKDIEAWIDVERLRIGGKLYNWLEMGIRHESDVFLPILTPHYLSSANCQMELKYAIELSRREYKPILPVVLSDCQIPMVLEDIIWGDFRSIFDEHGVLDKEQFNIALKSLVSSIRYFAKRSERLKLVASSGVRSISDLWFFLFNHMARYYDYVDTAKVFRLYCDIVEERGFQITAADQFISDLHNLIEDKQYIVGNGHKVDIRYLVHVVRGVPEKIQVTKKCRKFIAEADKLRSKAGL